MINERQYNKNSDILFQVNVKLKFTTSCHTFLFLLKLTYFSSTINILNENYFTSTIKKTYAVDLCIIRDDSKRFGPGTSESIGSSYGCRITF